jgi:alpha-tubulin suppressor-like RCC1 family protein
MKRIFVSIFISIILGCGSSDNKTVVDDSEAVERPSVNETLFQTLAAGVEFTCEIVDGRPKCWGRNLNDILMKAKNITNAISIDAGYQHICVVLEDKKVSCWGNNDYGQIDVPPDLTDVKAIALGFNHSCAVTEDNEVICWGSNDRGQLEVPNFSGEVSLIDANASITCIVTLGVPKCWGSNTKGQTEVPENINNVSSLGVGWRHVCVTSIGKVICWGDNTNSQTLVPSNLTNVKKVVAGNLHSCAATNSNVVCWGIGFDGEAEVPDIEGEIEQLTTSFSHICAKSNKSLYCWGRNLWGESFAPGRVGEVRAIRLSRFNVCVLGSTGFGCLGSSEFPIYRPNEQFSQLVITDSFYCLGGAYVMCNGSVDAINQDVPEVSGVVKSMHQLGERAVCIRDDLSLKCWGEVPPELANFTDLAGNSDLIATSAFNACWSLNDHLNCIGIVGDINDVPFQEGDISNLKEIKFLFAHGCISDDFGLKCWGSDAYGQLSEIPQNLPSNLKFAIGGGHTCTLSEGQVQCWGRNESGEVDVPSSLSEVKDIYANFGWSCVEQTESLRCWGEDNLNELLIYF